MRFLKSITRLILKIKSPLRLTESSREFFGIILPTNWKDPRSFRTRFFRGSARGCDKARNRDKFASTRRRNERMNQAWNSFGYSLVGVDKFCPTSTFNPDNSHEGGGRRRKQFAGLWASNFLENFPALKTRSPPALKLYPLTTLALRFFYTTVLSPVAVNVKRYRPIYASSARRSLLLLPFFLYTFNLRVRLFGEQLVNFSKK